MGGLLRLYPAGTPTAAARWRNAAAGVLLLLLLAVCVSGLLKPLVDYDFFWHLKSGEWIWQHKALVSGDDPFCYTAPSSLSEPQRFTLDSYWLSQVILHLIERSAGLGGIVVLNFFLLSAILGVMWWRREGGALTYLGLLLLMAVVLVMFPFERPQIYSFLGFAILLGLLGAMRAPLRAGAFPFRALGACVLLMAIWANLHPGFVVGIAALGLFGTEVLGRRILGKAGEAERRRCPAILAALTAALLVTLLNPNGWQVVRHLELPAVLTAGVLEYQSSIHWFRDLGAKQMLAYWFLLAATALAVARRPRSVHLPEAVLLLVMGYLSFKHIRHMPFFLVLALPVAGRGLSGAPRGGWFSSAVVFAALVGGTATMLAWNPQFQPLRERRWVNEGNLPVEAASFVLKADLPGRMYNHFSWGGYLSWRLGPDRKVFIDGRVGDARPAWVQATDLDAGRSDVVRGRPFWNRVFDEWGVSWVITPLFDVVGALTPLPLHLRTDPEWEPIFLGGNAVIFVRRSPMNALVIQRYALGKSNFVRYLLTMVDMTLASVPRHVPLLVSRGDLLRLLGRTQEARETYSRAAEVAPGDPVPRARLQAIPEPAAHNGEVRGVGVHRME